MRMIRLAAILVLPCVVVFLSIALPLQSALGQEPHRPLVDLSKLLNIIDRADKVAVFEKSEVKAEHNIYSSADPKDLSALRSSITIEQPHQWFQCACMPSTVIKLYRGDRSIGEFAIFGGNTIRFADWSSDARIANTKAWFQWLDTRGIKSPRKEFDEETAREQQAQRATDRWQRAMPKSLRPLWPEVVSKDPVGAYDTTSLDAELIKEYSDLHPRILRLMGWYGSGAGPWSGYPAYESVAEQMLLEYPTPELVAAVSGRQLSEEEMEGAARLFGGWEFNRSRPSDNALIPDDLKTNLLEHSLRSTDEDKRNRAKHAFER